MIDILHQKPLLGRQINWAHPLAFKDILEGCWIMNERSGSKIYDLSGFGRHGPLTNVNWTVTQEGSGINFDPADNGYIQVSTAGILSTLPNATVEGIVRQDTVAPGTGSPLYCERNAGTPIWKFQVRDLQETLQFTHRDNASQLTRLYGIKDIVDGNYHHIVMRKEGTNIQFYIDGIFDFEGTLLGTDTLSTGNVRIGDDANDVNAEWDGDIVLVRIYSDTISPDNIAWLSREPYAMFQQNRVRRFSVTGG
ncbi:hypothetical protein LCGC14_3056740, partial [marine sediment metagenome]